MSTGYQIDTGRRRVIIVAEGGGGLEEAEALFRAIVNDPALAPGFDVLLDLSAQAWLPETADVRQESEWLDAVRERVGFRRFAAVAPSDILFGMSRMFAALNEKAFEEARVFRSRDEADRWLDEEGD